jgi:N6-L-threonylcarbamoyladenine synthase
MESLFEQRCKDGKDRVVLAIESSCDETSVAIVKNGREQLSCATATQIDIHALYGGVVPEIASRAHTEAICGLMEKALNDAGMTVNDVDAIGVTNTPGLIGALLTGVCFAKGLSYATGKPLIAIDHIKGHVAANYLCHPDLEPPFTALVVSGGHTSLFAVDSYTSYRVIGSTRDDAAGEVFDKAARVLGLPYPGGAAMDKLASEGDPKALKLTVSKVEGSKYDFSFSGLKTAVINRVHQLTQKGEELDHKTKCDIAASMTYALIRTVTTRVEAYFEEFPEIKNRPIVLAGGVAANSHLRKALKETAEKHGATLYQPPLSLCGDNAAMIASQGFYEPILTKEEALKLNAFATARINPLKKA